MTRYIGSWQTPSIKLPEAAGTSAPGIWKLDEQFMLQKWGRWPTGEEIEELITQFTSTVVPGNSFYGQGIKAVFALNNEYAFISNLPDQYQGVYRNIQVFKRNGGTYQGINHDSYQPYTGTIDEVISTNGVNYFLRRQLGLLSSVTMYTFDTTTDTFATVGSTFFTGNNSNIPLTSSMTPDATHIAFGVNSEVKIYKREENTISLLTTLSAPTTGWLYCKYIQNGNKLIIFNSNGFIHIFNRSGDIYTQLPTISLSVSVDLETIRVDSSGNYFIITINESPYFKVYRLIDENIELLSFPIVFADDPKMFDISRDGKIIAISLNDVRQVELFLRTNNEYNQLIGTVEINENVTPRPDSLRISEDGTRLYVGGYNSPYYNAFSDIEYS